MTDAPPKPADGDEPLPVRRPWVAAMLLACVATPAAVILAIPAPAPLDALLAWPLVLIDRWMGAGDPHAAPAGADALARVVAGLAGIALNWVHYVLLARLLVWRIARPAP